MLSRCWTLGRHLRTGCNAVRFQNAFVPVTQNSFSSYSKTEDIPGFDDSELVDTLLDPEYDAFLRDVCRIPHAGHNVLVLHPDVKWGPMKKINTTAELQMAEACTLIKTLPNWKVVEEKRVSVKNPRKEKIFGKGNLEMLKDISFNKKVSAVFLNVNMLTGTQRQFFFRHWGVPVFDRYTIVLQIFKEHAKTKEAKLQIALAEIPYLIKHQSVPAKHGGIQQVTGTRESYVHSRAQLLEDRAAKLKKILEKLKAQRQLIRKNRVKKQLPIVAVVGYTNAGKTTLIKALTGDKDLVPEDHLFATLDVTAHAGILPSKMTVIYMDTVGFISDIPTSLLDAFSATLEDALIADLVIHVQDVSHPDFIAQKQNVVDTMKRIFPESYEDNVIEINNKVDLLPHGHDLPGDQISICATSGKGIPRLMARIERFIMEKTGRKKRRIKVPLQGPMLSWLYKEASVSHAQPDESQENYIVDCVMTDAVYQKMKATFGRDRQKT